MRLQDNLEIELKLTVGGSDPDALLNEVEKLDEIASFAIGEPAQHRIHDIYWDLPDGGLHESRLSLRLRDVDGRVLFTAKGGTSSGEGLFRRYELEVDATRQNWDEVRAALEQEGASLKDGALGEAPADWLRAAGLVPTQNRITRRTVRYVYGATEPHRPLAELALDRTRFNFGMLKIDYWEIEIEELGGGDEIPRQIGRTLLERYPDRLSPSTMGKYSRGLWLERELRAAGKL